MRKISRNSGSSSSADDDIDDEAADAEADDVPLYGENGVLLVASFNLY